MSFLVAFEGLGLILSVDNYCLQLLLGYLPPDRGLWSSELAKKRAQYKHFKDELLMNPVSHVYCFLFPFLCSCLGFEDETEKTRLIIQGIRTAQFVLI